MQGLNQRHGLVLPRHVNFIQSQSGLLQGRQLIPLEPNCHAGLLGAKSGETGRVIALSLVSTDFGIKSNGRPPDREAFANARGSNLSDTLAAVKIAKTDTIRKVNHPSRTDTDSTRVLHMV